jgi:ferredoxin-NADP reductase
MAETSITSSESVGVDTIAVELETPSEFDGAPGQFVLVSADIDGTEESSYYTLSSPDVNGTFEITVAVDDEGSVGTWLAAQSPGDTVSIDGPFGDIAYDGSSDVLVLAGGPGVGPGVAIGERALPNNDVTIVYRDDTYVHADRLDTLEASGATVEYVAREDPLDPALLSGCLDRQVFVFGFEAFVADGKDAIVAAGGDVEDTCVESFGPE